MIHIENGKLVEKKLCHGACGRYLELRQFYQNTFGKPFSKCCSCQSEVNRLRYHKNKILKTEISKVGRPRVLA